MKKENEKITLDDWMSKNAEPGVLYHVGAGSSFLFIGDKDTYKREMPTVSIIHKERLKIQYRRALALVRVDTNERGKLSIYSSDADVDRSLDFIVKRLIFDIAKTRKTLKALRKEYNLFINFGARWVREVYDRELGGVAILIEGDDKGDFWFQDEYEKAMTAYRHIRGAASSRPAQIEKILFEKEDKTE